MVRAFTVDSIFFLRAPFFLHLQCARDFNKDPVQRVVRLRNLNTKLHRETPLRPKPHLGLRGHNVVDMLLLQVLLMPPEPMFSPRETLLIGKGRLHVNDFKVPFVRGGQMAILLHTLCFHVKFC